MRKEADAMLPGLSVKSDQTAGLHPCFQTGWVSNLFGAARRGHTYVLLKRIRKDFL